MITFCNRAIRFSFYALFFFVPIIFAGNTSELFEFNKLWLTFFLILIIAFFWIAKIILTKQIHIKRTWLDIPLLLFLASQLIATIFSLDTHVSLWGYYSRFNGGFLSLLAYVFLYYALTSNFSLKDVIRLLYATIAGGIFVALWGLPSHFGYDPTCFLFRGTFDVSCWTFAFQPKVRIFSTMGQPDWLAVYLVALMPLSMAFGIYFAKIKRIKTAVFFFLATILFYLDLLFTNARSGFVGVVIMFAAFLGLYVFSYWKSIRNVPVKKLVKKHQYFVALLIATILVSFVFGTPIQQVNTFMLPGIVTRLTTKPQPASPKVTTPPTPSPLPAQEIGGTDSGKIRLFVWRGALDIWLHNPIFGTGVETFAFAYYLYRPAGHNLTSEWDYLYNKAHNEYLNYLATTGIVGLGTYLAFLAVTILFFWKKITGFSRQLSDDTQLQLLLLIGLVVSFVSMCVIDFFGFSVVIINVFLFVFPGLGVLLAQEIPQHSVKQIKSATISPTKIQYAGVSIAAVAVLFCIIYLARYWAADVSYALGNNLDHAGEYQNAYAPLHSAASTIPSEPTYKDELSINDAVLAVAFANQKDTTDATKLAQEAITTSNEITTNHPNNVVYWKSRVRILYTLSQLNSQYLPDALLAIQKAYALAPTDAKVSYNLGLLYGQTGNYPKGIQVLTDTIKLKIDYRDAYYARGIFYHTLAVDKNNKVINEDLQQKAIADMQFILNHLGGQDKPASDALKTWGVQ